MFFVRAAFWIFLILLLLPTNDREKSDFYTAAGRTISDLGDFCTRNPDVCDRTGAIFSMFIRKIQEAVHSIDNAIAGDGDINAKHDRDRHPGYTIRERTPDPRAQSRGPGPAYMAPAVDGSQNTLRQEDLAPAWRGPAGSGLRM